MSGSNHIKYSQLPHRLFTPQMQLQEPSMKHASEAVHSELTLSQPRARQNRPGLAVPDVTFDTGTQGLLLRHPVVPLNCGATNHHSGEFDSGTSRRLSANKIGGFT